MIKELIVTLVIIAAACWVVFQMFSFFKKESTRTLIVIGYGLFSISILSYWFMQHMNELTL